MDALCLLPGVTGAVDAGRASEVVIREPGGFEAIARGAGAGNSLWDDSPECGLELGLEEDTRRDAAPGGPR